MEPNKKLTPHFFFLSIGVLVTLIATVSSFISLIFATLDHVLPDVLTATYQYGYASYSYEDMRGALAILIIVFPVFLILSRFWNKAMQKDMSHWDSIIRKWAIYLILFLASIAVVVDLVTLVRYFVSGEITLRFVLKVLAVLVVATISGWYYISHIKSESMLAKCGKWFAIGTTVLVVASIVWSFAVMGSPMSQRALRIDQRRVDDLQSIQWQVINFWQQKEKLPEKLDELTNPLSGYSLPKDPEFQKGMSYEYNKLGKMKFELCATFAKPIPKGWVENKMGYGFGMGGDSIMPARDVAVSSMPYPGGIGDSWDHEAGRTCFERTIDPELYPPYPKPGRG